jgi:hypothetical protein
MHTALVQKLLRDRSAWELAHRCESAEEAEPATNASASSIVWQHA